MPIPKAQEAFPRDEFLRRIGLVKAEMQRRNITVVLVTDEANTCYLTGYTAKSGYVPQGVVVSLGAEEPTIILRKQDAIIALHEAFMNRQNIIGYDENLVGNPDKNGYDAIIDFLFEAGLVAGTLGLELSNLVGRAAEAKFHQRLPGSKFVDFTLAVTWIRGIKSDLEIAVMREAAAISDAAILRAAEVIRPGVHESDIAAEIAEVLIRGASGIRATNFVPFYLCSSPRTGASHINWSQDVLRKDSQVGLELSGVRHNYAAPLLRTYTVGPPSDRLRRIHEAEVAGLEAALDVIRPGNLCHDVADAFYRTIEKHGFTKDSRCGYSVGIDWLEPTASLKIGDKTVLKPNMTFHLNLGNWGDEDFGYGISETFRVTETGVEVLTQARRELFQL
ncbi:M24 family metallopeptidase [Mesorhizobium sp. RIZ17]|uniref:M24 family metallopeptidase n=1 Tax=Mesorhizobium sp. RIZ17 TaxID=3132743 RepID=UPI003DA91FB8